MFANPPLSLKLRKVFFVALLVLICAILVYWLTQENKLWVVPEEYKSLKNPLPASPSNLDAAREIYFDECVQCHGERGQGDGPQAKSHECQCVGTDQEPRRPPVVARGPVLDGHEALERRGGLAGVRRRDAHVIALKPELFDLLE